MALLCRLLGPRPRSSEWVRVHADTGAHVWKRLTVCLRCGEMQWGHTAIGPRSAPLYATPTKEVLGCWR